jgi:hypothetical protein
MLLNKNIIRNNLVYSIRKNTIFKNKIKSY